MKKRSLGVMLVVAIVLVLSLAVVASASAAPYLTSVSPTSAANTTYSSTQLKIYGQSLTDFIGDPEVTLYQRAWPYDYISGTDVYVVGMMGGDYISCYIDTYAETTGSYDVVVSGYWLIGQSTQDLTLSAAFSVTGGVTPPVTYPTIASVSPNAKNAGDAGFTMTVNGANFGTSPTVYWNGTALATAPGGLPNPTAVCTAAVPATLIANAGVAMITVASGAQTSNAVPFTVTAVLPTLTSLSPTSTWAHYITPPQVTLTGTKFASTAQVLVNGVVHASTYASATQMTVQLTAADIAGAGTLNFSVRNTTSGGLTASLPFTLNADNSAPVTTIMGADTAWHNTPVTLTITAGDAGGSGVQKTYYGIGIPPSILLSGSTVTVPAPAGGASDGAQLVQAYAVDNCNNAEVPPVSVTVNICTKGADTSAFAPASVKKGKTLKIGYECDSITPTVTATMKIYKSSGSVAKAFNLGQKNANQNYTKSFTCNLAPGSYKVKVFATDAAGNAQSSQDSDSFTVTK